VANQKQAMRVRDIRRIIGATRAAGVDIGSVTVNPNTGEVTVSAGKPGASEQQTEGNNVDL
jgi:hypothetical protein